MRLRIGRAAAVGIGLYALVGAGWLVWGTRFYPELSVVAVAAFAKTQIWTAVLLFMGLAVSLWGLRHQRRLWRWTGGGVLVVLLCFDLYQAYGFFYQGEVSPAAYYQTNHFLVDKYQDLVRRNGPTRFAQLEDGRFGQFAMDRVIPLVERNFETPQGAFDLPLQKTMTFRQLTNETALLDLQNVGLAVHRNSKTGAVRGEERPSCLPRVVFYAAAQSYASDAAILRDLNTGALDYRRVVAVLSEEFSTALPALPPADAPSEVELLKQSQEHYQIRYHARTPGIIFVSESYYPGWEVRDETGQRFQLVHAFIAFKGIVIPKAGRGTLDVRFRPKSLFLGASITGGTALALVVLYIWLFRREQRRNDEVTNNARR